MAKISDQIKKSFSLDSQSYLYFSLPRLADQFGNNVSRLPYSIRILMEGCLRNLDRESFTEKHIQALATWKPDEKEARAAVPFLPARVLMQDFTGLPVLNDLTALRAALKRAGNDPLTINPYLPSDLVIDHSIQVEAFGCAEARMFNEKREFDQNYERYHFLKWSEYAYKNLRVLPPGIGICHQVNLEHLGKVVLAGTGQDENLIFPDSVLGTDSHTPMINGLGILGWGVGGIEVLAAMLGYPSEFPIPDVIGVKLSGSLPDHATPTDLTLTLTSQLRDLGVVGKFVEVFGENCTELPVETRAMISNMSPESGATITYFPVDKYTLDYLLRTGRTPEHVRLVETYFREQGLFRDAGTPRPEYSEIFEFDLESVVPVLAGPKRPQDIFSFKNASDTFKESLTAPQSHTGFNLDKNETEKSFSINIRGKNIKLSHGTVLIAAITSCTNTSDPSVMIAAGLLARNAVALGLSSKPWVKTSFAPGSRTVCTYLKNAKLLDPLEALGFHIVGYGCTTCIGNSGLLDAAISKAVIEKGIIGAGVLSGNRNFEGRINPHVRANYLASPPLVVAYSLAGRMDFDFSNTPLGTDTKGKAVYLRDIYPKKEEILLNTKKAIIPGIYLDNYSGLNEGNSRWDEMDTPQKMFFPWAEKSTLIREPDFLLNDGKRQPSIKDIEGAYALAYLGNSITTDHISPAGRISPENPAGKYLASQGIKPQDFISFGARRGNHEIMTRGTFSNPRLHNRIAPDKEGGYTTHFPSGQVMSIFEASQLYMDAGIPLIILAGKAYGTGSSRDWAAKGTYLMGIRAVIAESYERIHRTNLVCMGVLPLQYLAGENAQLLGLQGNERFTVKRLKHIKEPKKRMTVHASRSDGKYFEFEVDVRIDTPLEVAYFQAGGLARKILADQQRE